VVLAGNDQCSNSKDVKYSYEHVLPQAREDGISFAGKLQNVTQGREIQLSY
jgi:hypothetical protein